MSATLAPKPAAPAALTRPAVPPPMTTKLYFFAGVGLTMRTTTNARIAVHQVGSILRRQKKYNLVVIGGGTRAW